MDWFDFLLGVLTALVWPAVLLLALLLFHDPIRKLIPRIQQVTIGVFSATLQKTEEATTGGAEAPGFVFGEGVSATTVSNLMGQVPNLSGGAEDAAQATAKAVAVALQEAVQTALDAQPRLTLPSTASLSAEAASHAADHPLVAIENAWGNVRDAAVRCASRLQAGEEEDAEERRAPPPADLLAALNAIQARARVPVELYYVVFRLQLMESQARAAKAGSISGSEALAYVRLAQRAIHAFDAAGVGA